MLINPSRKKADPVEVQAWSRVCNAGEGQRNFFQHTESMETQLQKGIIMCEQGKSLDLAARNAVFLEKIPADILAEVIDIYIGCVEMIKPGLTKNREAP